MTPRSPSLSVVLPAYNEAGRLPPYLRSIREYLERTLAGEYQVVVVDDGSKDGLRDLLEQVQRGWPELHVCRHEVNRGKGAAVRTGMLEAQGDLLLLADADGATPIEEELGLRAALEAGADIAVGSRLLDDAAGKQSKRSRVRAYSGRSFAWLVRRVFSIPLRDTQCGFKMFRGEVARALFTLCGESGYLIDLEVLLLARKLGLRIEEAPVRWRDVPGSKVRLVRDGLRMARGLFRLRNRLRSVGVENQGNPMPDVVPVHNG